METSCGRLPPDTQTKRPPLDQTNPHPQNQPLHNRSRRLRARQTSQRRDPIRRHDRALVSQPVEIQIELGETRVLLPTFRNRLQHSQTQRCREHAKTAA